MHLDHNLNCDMHISKLDNKLFCYSVVFYTFRNYLSKIALSFVYSYLTDSMPLALEDQQRKPSYPD